LGNAAGGGDFQAIGKELKLGDSLVAIVVVDDGIDHGLAQGDRIEKADFLALFVGDAGEGSVFEIELVEHLFRGFDEATIAVFFVFDQFDSIFAGIFGDFDGGVVDVGQ
jgi:hypothetical protein